MLTEESVIHIGQQAIWVMIMVGAPTMLTALVVGLIVSLIQALTQIQEMTLTFVPKLVAMFAILVISLPFMMAQMNDFTVSLFARIAGQS